MAMRPHAPKRFRQPDETFRFGPIGAGKANPLDVANDADAIWRECVDKGFYGADTSDFTIRAPGRPSREPQGRSGKH